MKRSFITSLIISIVVLLVFLFTRLQFQKRESPPPPVDASDIQEKAEFVPGEVLVVFKEELPIDENVLGLESETNIPDIRLRRLKQKNIDTVERISKDRQLSVQTLQRTALRPSAFDRTYKLSIRQKEKSDTLRLVDELKKDLAVEDATLNYIRYPVFVPNDPLYSQQWGLNQSNNFDINAPEAWDLQRGLSSVVVAVIDTGLYFAHPEFAGRVFENSGEIGTDSQSRDKKTNGVDDDGNGYVDDWRGYDMTTCAELTYYGTCSTKKDRDNDATDENGHGTHTAGVIGATGNNTVGISGINWSSKVFPVQVFGKTGGGSCSDIMAAVSYASKFADVISMSLGGSSPCAGEEGLFTSLHAQNIVVVASAGNESSSKRHYPAASPFVISVASIDKTGTPSSFSNFGDWVDFTAPGGEVLSTALPGTEESCVDPDGDGYALCSGTSMSAPQVSGVASLVLSKNPALTADQVFNILANSAKDIGSVGKDDRMGYGLVDAQKALTDMNMTSPPELVISSPSEESTIGKSTQIRGTVKANGFVRYELSYASVATPQNWQTVGITLSNPSIQISDGVLGQWSLSSLSKGDYLLKLTLVTTTVQHTVIKKVTYDSTLLGSWPKAVGRSDVVVVADMNADAMRELIVQSEDGISVFSSDGTMMPGWPKIIPYENVIFTKEPVVGNFVNNASRPGKQIVYRVLHSDSTFDLYAYHTDGTLVPGWPQKGRSVTGVLGNLTLSDLKPKDAYVD